MIPAGHVVNTELKSFGEIFLIVAYKGLTFEWGCTQGCISDTGLLLREDNIPERHKNILKLH